MTTVSMNCHFCEKSREATTVLIAGPKKGDQHIFICGDCVADCATIIAEQSFVRSLQGIVQGRFKLIGEPPK